MRRLLFSLLLATVAHGQVDQNKPFPPHKVAGNVYYVDRKSVV